MIEFTMAKKKDLILCAEILRNIYNNNVLNEGWTVESSISICEFYFKLQPDLFFVAKNNDEVVGFTFCFIKPWADGNQLMIEELSVKENYRKQKIGKTLLKKLIVEAKQKYNITCINGITYDGDNDMPYSWYKRIGFKKVDDLFLIAGNASEVIEAIK